MITSLAIKESARLVNVRSPRVIAVHNDPPFLVADVVTVRILLVLFPAVFETQFFVLISLLKNTVFVSVKNLFK